MAETAADKIQSLDIEDTHGDGMYGADEGVVMTSPPSTCDHDENYAKGIPPYGLLPHSAEDDLSLDKTDQLSDQLEYDENERLSPLSPNARKKYGINARNDAYRPGGGNIRIFSEKIEFKNITPRIDSRSKSPRKSPPSSTQSPARQSPRTILSHSSPSPNTRNIRSKIGSLDNAKHTPGGGRSPTKTGSTRLLKKTSRSKDSPKKKKSKIKIINRKEKYDAVQSKVGSKDNITHRPGGGHIKIENKRLSFLETAKPKVGSLDKVDYKPGGGEKKIEDQKLEWKVEPKVGSKDNLKHMPGGGEIKIESQKAEEKEVIGDGDHQAVGGIIASSPPSSPPQVESLKLKFKENAEPRTDTGISKS